MHAGYRLEFAQMVKLACKANDTSQFGVTGQSFDGILPKTSLAS
jgi:hypothetical protein